MPRPKRTHDKTRVTIVLNAQSKRRLVGLQRDSGADTMSAAIARALEIYEKVLRHQCDGGRIVLEKDSEPPRELLV